jgi:DNA-binding transcriptional ArsR family regulator
MATYIFVVKWLHNKQNDFGMKLRRDPFQAIADPTRRAILVLLAAHTMTAGAIADNFSTARPTISKHIQILNECELIEASQQGREIFYQLKVDKIKDIDQWLGQFRKIWESRFDQLDNVLSTILNKKDEA